MTAQNAPADGQGAAGNGRTARNLLAHLAHVELLTPRLDESVAFYKDVIGLEETAREGDSVYLRCWGDYYSYSLVLTQADQPGLGHGAWRTYGPEELEQAVANIEASGVRGEWIEESVGHGRAYRFRGPGGHPLEIFWEVERYVAPPELRSTFPTRPQRRTGRGTAPRQIDHLTVATKDVMGDAAWYRDNLGFRFMEWTGLEHDPSMVVFGTVTTNEKSHDLGLGIDFSGAPGRLHHFAFWVDSVEELQITADLVMEAGTPMEYGPSIHGIGEQMYLYFREPSGVRVEVNTAGYRNYVPDWEPVEWKPSQGANNFYRNSVMPDSMMEAFPPADGPAAGEHEHEAAIGGGAQNPWGQQGQG